MHEERLAELAVEVAALEDFRNAAARCRVDRLRGGGELAAVEDANHDAAGALFFWAAALYAKFHLFS